MKRGVGIMAVACLPLSWLGLGQVVHAEGGSIISWGEQVVVAQHDLTDLVAVAAGGFHSLGLKSDGSIVAWGFNSCYGEANIPAPNTGFIAVAAGYWHSL